MLVEWLPRSVKLATIDDLVRESFPGVVGMRSARNGTTDAVSAAIERLSQRGPKPIVIVAARFERPEARRDAYRRAREIQASFLYVEARSSNIRAIRRLFRLVHSNKDPARQLALYDDAVARYVPVSMAERTEIPCVLLRSVLSNLDASCATILGTWNRGA